MVRKLVSDTSSIYSIFKVHKFNFNYFSTWIFYTVQKTVIYTYLASQKWVSVRNKLISWRLIHAKLLNNLESVSFLELICASTLLLTLNHLHETTGSSRQRHATSFHAFV
jgi:hypothetical protein